MNLPSKLSIIKSCAVAFIVIGLSGCGSNGNVVKVCKTNGFQQNHGPFDDNGNYVENWADNPPVRKIAWKPSIPTKPVIKPISKPSRNIFSSLAKAKPATPAPRAAPQPNNTAVARTAPPRQTYTTPPPPTRTAYTPPKKVTPPVVVKNSTAKKITPKAKPPVVHTVKKGDTLSALARKYGTSIAAIQKVNNIKGSNIVIGKKLTIPRK